MRFYGDHDPEAAVERVENDRDDVVDAEATDV
jgi:hypothetical protein